jgi:curli biogenesis system outer membrane secretion channel CsgG
MNIRFLMALAILSGCATGSSKSTMRVNETLSEDYNGPKARIVVKDIQKSRSVRGYHLREITEGVSEMLITALFESGRFIVLEKQDRSDLREEQDLLAEGGNTLEGADILLTGAITGYKENESGGGLDIGLDTINLGPLQAGGSSAKVKSAWISADFRLVDVRTGRVLGTAKAEGRANDMDLSGIGVRFRTIPASAKLGGYKNTPVEKAVRAMIESAVSEIAEATPDQYYRVGGNRQTASEKGGKTNSKRKPSRK